MTKSAKKRLISSSSSSSNSSGTSHTAALLHNQQLPKKDELDFQAIKEIMPKLISSDQAPQPSLSNNVNTLSSSISNSLIEFKKLSNTAQETAEKQHIVNEQSSILNTSGALNNSLNTPVSLSDIQTTLFFKSSPNQQTTTTTTKSSPITTKTLPFLSQSGMRNKVSPNRNLFI